MKTSGLDLLEKSQLSPSQARVILQVMESELATRDDLKGFQVAMVVDLKAALAEFRTDLRTEFREGLHTLELRMEGLRSELKGDIHQVRSDLIRWNFAFWAAQLGAIIALFKMAR